jgi:hypothetical protein
MNERLISFGNSAVRIVYDGDACRELIDFLFGGMGTEGNADPHRTFRLSYEMKECQFQVECTDPPESSHGDAGSVGVYLMERVCYHLADRCSNGLLFHGACLAKERRAYFLPGRSGSGKSSLSLYLTRHLGYEFLTDEFTLIEPGKGLCRGLTRPIHLKAAAAKLFPELNEKDWLPIHPVEGKPCARLVGISAVKPARQVSYPLAAIIHPQYKAGETTSLQPLSAADAALHLTGCLINARNLPGHGFAELTRLVQTIPAWHLVYSSHDDLPNLDRTGDH